MKQLLDRKKSLLVNKRGLSVVGGGAVLYSPKVLALNPIAYYPLDEVAGTTAHDQSGNDYDAVWQGYQPDLTWGVDGIGDGLTAINFAGGYGYGSLDASAAKAAFSPDEMTISMWLKPTFLANPVFLIQWTNGTDVISIQYTATTGLITTLANMGGVAVQPTDGVQMPSGGSWHHIAIIVSRTTQQIKLYIDGLQVNNVGHYPVGTWGAAPTTLTIGAHSNTYYNYCGDMAHVAIFDSALPGQDIVSLASETPYSAPISFLAFGDSKVIGTGDTIETQGWVYDMTQLAALVEAPTRIGVGGWTVALVASDAGGITYAEHYIRISNLWVPNYIFVNLGVNELGGAAINAATWQTNMGTIVDTLHTRYPLAPVYIDRVHRFDGNENGQETDLDDTWIPAVIAAGRSAWCQVGIDERLILNAGNCDGLHPNHAGYLAMAQARLTQLGL